MREQLIYTGKEEAYIYSTHVLANYCMPTLLKAKPSNLVCVDKSKTDNESAFFHWIKQEIDQFQCCYTILFETGKIAILLIYQPQLLLEILSKEENQSVLKRYGYEFSGDIVTNSLSRVKIRYLDYCHFMAPFPHEIGILLGYPYQDVEDFIKNEGKNYLICGHWKVYHNVSSALETFDLYNRMKEDAKHIIIAGRSLKELELSYTMK